MKRIISLAMAALMVCSIATAQTTKETIRERRQIARLAQSELNAKASKAAKKEAKNLKKQGWVVAPGQLPLEKQLDRAYSMYYEYEESGLPKYIIGDAMSPGKTYDAAKMQALELAKTNLAGQIQTEITALIENTVANQQLGAEEAASITETVMASKNLISQSIGRVVPVVEAYRPLKNGNKEVYVSIAYNNKAAWEGAKKAIVKELEKKGDNLHEKLGKLMDME
jgi:hypothetical protein